MSAAESDASVPSPPEQVARLVMADVHDGYFPATQDIIESADLAWSLVDRLRAENAVLREAGDDLHAEVLCHCDLRFPHDDTPCSSCRAGAAWAALTLTEEVTP